MTRQSTSLRHAFASNPMRFLAVPTPRPPAVAQFPSEVQSNRQLPLAPQSSAEQERPLSDQFNSLGLHGMARALARLEGGESEQTASPSAWLTALIDGEIADRKERRVARRLRAAKLRYQAPMAEVDYNALRGFDDGLFHWLAVGQWIADRENVIIDGPTGVGKTWLACALGESACRDERSVRYERVPELLAELSSLRDTPRYARRLRPIKSTELLILDDWGVEHFGPEQRHDILEIIEYRYGRGSTMIASQVPVEDWSATIGDPAIAAIVLDRLIHNTHRLQLRGESLRNQRKALAGPTTASR